jgi:HSP20 family molecular chaperone IbpA
MLAKFPYYNDWFDAGIDSFVTDIFADLFGGAHHSVALKVQSTKDDKAEYLRVELPGFSEKEVSVLVEGKLLTVSAKQEKSDKKSHQLRDFSRSWTLASCQDSEKVTAEYKAGVVTVTVPWKEKAPETKSTVRQIPVKTV